MMHAPKFALEVASHFIALVNSSFLADCGVTDLVNVVLCCPSPTTIKSIMFDEAVDTILLEKKRMKNINLTLLGDKGEDENKRGGAASFVILVAMYNAKLSRVRVTCIGIQGAGNTSVDLAVGIDHCLKVFDYGDARVKLSNHTTDAGGGGTRLDLMLKLGEVNRVKNMETYIYSTCALHGLNLCLSTPTTETMGYGGLLKRNALQLLHNAYSLSQ